MATIDDVTARYAREHAEGGGAAADRLLRAFALTVPPMGERQLVHLPAWRTHVQVWAPDNQTRPIVYSPSGRVLVEAKLTREALIDRNPSKVEASLFRLAQAGVSYVEKMLSHGGVRLGSLNCRMVLNAAGKPWMIVVTEADGASWPIVTGWVDQWNELLTRAARDLVALGGRHEVG